MKTSKWKIGDLVTLSAAGKRVEANWSLTQRSNGEKIPVGFGMVIKVHPNGRGHRWPVFCQWFGNEHQRNWTFKDYELKKFKTDKTCP